MKTLKFEIVSLNGGMVKFRIKNQSHRGKNFGEKGLCGWGPFISNIGPELISNNILCVRGESEEDDNIIIECSQNKYCYFVEQAKEYEKHFFTDKDIKHVLTNSPICPYCGSVADLNTLSVGKNRCVTCGRVYNCITSVLYTTKKMQGRKPK